MNPLEATTLHVEANPDRASEHHLVLAVLDCALVGDRSRRWPVNN